MPKTVTITWVLPNTRQKGGLLPIDEIAHTRVELSADSGENFAELAEVPPGAPQEWVVPDLEAGEWQFRLTVLDTEGRVGAPHVELVEVADDSPPDAVTNVTASQV